MLSGEIIAEAIRPAAVVTSGRRFLPGEIRAIARADGFEVFTHPGRILSKDVITRGAVHVA
jgi:hypothetical protein